MRAIGTWTTISFIFIFGVAHAQVGIRVGVDQIQAKSIFVLITETQEAIDAPHNGFSLGLDYWFRLTEKRIEFFPEFNLSHSIFDLPDGQSLDGQWYSLFFNTHIYVFDLTSDCNCPTFSKQRNLLPRGFFVSLSPGVTYGIFSSDSEQISAFERDHSDWIISIAGGLGLDIGISDLITITPFAQARYLLPFEGPTGQPPQNDQIPPPFQLQTQEDSGMRFRAGLRLGFRFDYR